MSAESIGPISGFYQAYKPSIIRHKLSGFPLIMCQMQDFFSKKSASMWRIATEDYFEGQKIRKSFPFFISFFVYSIGGGKPE